MAAIAAMSAGQLSSVLHYSFFAHLLPLHASAVYAVARRRRQGARTVRTSIALSVLMFMSGCSDEPTSSGDDAHEVTDTSVEADGTGDAAPDAVDSQDTGSGDAQNPGSGDIEYEIPEDTRRWAVVTVTSTATDPLKHSYASAMLYDQTPEPESATSEGIGSCTVFETPGDAGGGPLQHANAGPITISGAATPVTLDLDASGGYGLFKFSGALFQGGETLTFSATGEDDVPAFEAQVVAPTPVTIVEPFYESDADLEIDAEQDLTLSWTGGTEGQVLIYMTQQRPSEMPKTIAACLFDAATGEGVIPALVLARVRFEGTTNFIAVAYTESEVVVPHWGPVSVRAELDALTPGGAQYGTTVSWP